MKTHKREKNNSAYVHGFVSGVRGHSLEICPYVSDINLRAAWLGGWREGRTQHFEGFTGITQHEVNSATSRVVYH